MSRKAEPRRFCLSTADSSWMWHCAWTHGTVICSYLCILHIPLILSTAHVNFHILGMWPYVALANSAECILLWLVWCNPVLRVQGSVQIRSYRNSASRTYFVQQFYYDALSIPLHPPLNSKAFLTVTLSVLLTLAHMNSGNQPWLSKPIAHKRKQWDANYETVLRFIACIASVEQHFGAEQCCLPLCWFLLSTQLT